MIKPIAQIVSALLTLIAMGAAVGRFYAFTQPRGIITRHPFNQAIEAWLFSYRLPLSVHIVGVAAFLLIAPFQFHSRGAGRHRWLGKVATFLLIVSMLIAVPLSLRFTLESPLARAVTCLGAVLVLAFVMFGVSAAAVGNIAKHRRLMIAAYILLLATSLERVWIRGLGFLTTTPPDQLINFWVPVFSAGPILLAFMVATWPFSGLSARRGDFQ